MSKKVVVFLASIFLGMWVGVASSVPKHKVKVPPRQVEVGGASVHESAPLETGERVGSPSPKGVEAGIRGAERATSGYKVGTESSTTGLGGGSSGAAEKATAAGLKTDVTGGGSSGAAEKATKREK